MSPDSISGTMFLARVAIKGTTGAQVALRLIADQEPLAALGPDARLLVSADGKEQSFTLRELSSSPVVIYRFQASTTVGVRYALSRGAAQSIPDGSIRLIQYLISAEVAEATTPWVPERRNFAADIATTLSCVITYSYSLTPCGMEVWVSPFWGFTYSPGGTFQSKQGTGASLAIGITFGAPVTTVSATIYDPTYAGNRMVAYDSTGLVLGTAYFLYSGVPGVNLPNGRTVSHEGISRVVLFPAAGDYVAYDASFGIDPVAPGPPPCPAKVLASYTRISTEYAKKDALHPKGHRGRDYAVPVGTPVYAADSGLVTWAATAGSAGKAVVVKGTQASYYFHLSIIAVAPESTVKAGDLLGYSGSTGSSSTGPHLHFAQIFPPTTDPWEDGHFPYTNNLAPCTN